METGEAKAFEDQVTEILRSAVGNLSQQTHAEDQPGLGIHQASKGLVQLPTHVVRSSCSGNDNAICSIFALFFREEFGFLDAVWQEEEHGNRPDKCQHAKYNVHPHPWRERILDVPDAEGEEGGYKSSY